MKPMIMMIAILLAITAAPAAAQAPRTNPLVGDPKAAEEGRVAFRGSCSLCHGIKGEGGRGPDLTIGNFAAGDSDTSLFNVISNGAAGTEMPGFAPRFESDDIWRLVSYVRSIANSGSNRVTGNVSNGETLFWNKGQCGQCHLVNGRGKRMFPVPSHDASCFAKELGDLPLAGFFAAGEIGPVGGQNFLHGFTASLALFEEAE